MSYCGAHALQIHAGKSGQKYHPSDWKPQPGQLGDQQCPLPEQDTSKLSLG